MDNTSGERRGLLAGWQSRETSSRTPASTSGSVGQAKRPRLPRYGRG